MESKTDIRNITMSVLQGMKEKRWSDMKEKREKGAVAKGKDATEESLHDSAIVIW